MCMDRVLYSIIYVLVLSESFEMPNIRNLLSINYTGTWQSGTSVLPRADSFMAIGHWNGSIFLLGGTNERNALVEYNIISDQMIDYGNNSLPTRIFGYNTFYTQQNELLFMIDPFDNVLNVMDLSSKMFISNWHSVNMTPPIESGFRCLASTQEFIFMMGGYNTEYKIINDLQILSLSTYAWIPNAPSMFWKRYNHACVFHPESEKLYVMGGYGKPVNCSGYCSGDITSVEEIKVENILNNKWEKTTDLLFARHSARATTYGYNILVIGGDVWDDSLGNYKDIDEVEVINIYTNKVTLTARLNYPISSAAIINVQDRISVFGGVDHAHKPYKTEVNKWQYFDLPTAPTAAPTLPSVSPTISPSQQTVSPTIDPTSNPTKDTDNPTNAPSFSPSAGPTQPSIHPTYDPTQDPTYNPSAIPSRAPSQAPVIETTMLPVSFSMDSTTVIQEKIWFWILWGGILLLFMAAIILIYCLYRKNKAKASRIASKTMTLKNPMVILIGIGDYDEECENAEIEQFVTDLDGVDIDINNLLNLFRDTLNYQIYPQYDEYPNVYWKQQDLINFLEKQAEIFGYNVITNTQNQCENKLNFDGLIIAISCHGLNNQLLTSDMKLIEKNALHRVFSSYYPASREVPRFIIYDCCDGHEQLKTINTKKKTKTTSTVTTAGYSSLKTTGGDDAMDIGKTYTVEDIRVPTLSRMDSEGPALWQRYTQNPDHKLATVHAANFGFQSKMNNVDGSYLINKFVSKTLEGLEEGIEKQPFLFEVLDEIQQELGQSKQLPTFMYNNN
eukprot:511802_1